MAAMSEENGGSGPQGAHALAQALQNEDTIETTYQATMRNAKEESIKLQKHNKLLADILKSRQARDEAVERRAQWRATRLNKKDEDDEEEKLQLQMMQAEEQPNEEASLEDQPQAHDETVFEPQALQDVIRLPTPLSTGMPSTQYSPEQVFDLLLSQGQITTVYGAEPQVLQTLYNTAVTKASGTAAQQLLAYYRSLAPGRRPAWAPNWENFLSSLKQLGYISRLGSAPSSHKSSSHRKSSVPSDLAPAGQPGTSASVPTTDQGTSTDALQAEQQQDSKQPQASVRLHALACLQQLLGLLQGMCEISVTHDILEFSRATKATGASSLMALLELQLSPHVCAAVLTDLSTAIEAVGEAWSRADAPTWESVVREVSIKMPTFGPSYQAALDVLKGLDYMAQPVLQLQQSCLLSLLNSLMGPNKAPASSSSNDPVNQAMHLLFTVAPQAHDLLSLFKRTDPNNNKPDFCKILAVLECVFVLLWPRVHAPEGMGSACGPCPLQPHRSRSRLLCDARFGWPSSDGPVKPTRTAAGRKAPATTLAPPTNKLETSAEAPAIVKPAAPILPIPSLPSQVQQMSEFASQLVTSFSWPSLPQPSGQPAQVGVGMSASLLSQGVESGNKTQVPDISECLQSSVGVFEMKQMRKLAHLTGLTYKMATVTPRALRRKHALDLVTTSWACEIRGYEHAATAEETAEDGDGMAVSVTDAKSTYYTLIGKASLSSIQANSGAAAPSVVLGTVSPAQQPSSQLPKEGTQQSQPASQPQSTTPQVLQAQAQQQLQPQQQAQQQQAAAQQPPQPATRRWTSPAEMVAGMIGDAAAAATAAAATPLASAAGTIYAGLASLPIASALGAGPRSSAPAAAAALMSAAAAAVAANGEGGQRNEAARLAAAAGPAAIAAAPGSGTRLAALVQSTTGSPACPSEWFVCDDSAISTRYFVIQGSDTIDHWKLNLTFEPVSFEDPALGIKVHRGAYEAAQILFERFLPMVYEHLDSSPFAKICFTGHSIGGSLSTLLMMMYYYRGVLPASSIANVYTFGAPAVFCMDPDAPREPVQHSHHWHHQYNNIVPKPLFSVDGDAVEAPSPGLPRISVSNASQSPSTPPPARPCACGQEGISPLGAVGLPEHIVRNVIMVRDIVPRAFACDYSLVADILKGWGPMYKYHPGLAHPEHKHMYYFTGRIMVLQPDSWHWFARPEPDHPMLPAGPDLYLLANPSHDHQQQQQQQQHDKQHQHTHRHPSTSTTPSAGADLQQRATDTSAATAASQGTVGGTAATGNGNGVHRRIGDDGSSDGNGNGHVNGSGNGTYTITMSENGARHSNTSGNTSGSKKSGSSATASTNGKANSLAGAAAGAATAAATALAAGVGSVLSPRAKLHSAEAAVWALMDTPHPLDMLADPGAYLEKGSISRYHNPDNYTAALGRLIYLKRVQEGRIPSWVNRSYSRSLDWEAREANMGGYPDADQSLSPWDSSEGDMWMPLVPTIAADPSLELMPMVGEENEVDVRGGVAW